MSWAAKERGRLEVLASAWNLKRCDAGQTSPAGTEDALAYEAGT